MHYVVDKKQQNWGFFGVPIGHKWASWKRRKPTAWYLMPVDKHISKQGCNHQYLVTRYLTLAKVGQSTFAIHFLFVFNRISSALSFMASLLLIIYPLLFIILPVVSYLPFLHSAWSFQIPSVSFLSILFHPIICCLITQCYFLFWYRKCISGISIPITTTIWQVNKHNTTRLLHNLLS
jgi:hypothetical protein